AVALHQPHRTGVEIGPDCLGAMSRFGRDEPFRNEVERRLPACLLPAALALGSGAHQRLQKPIGMMDTVGVARHLGADNTGRVAVRLGTMDAADAVAAEEFNLESAGRGAVVRTGRMADIDLGERIHALSLPDSGGPLYSREM